jgi:IS30 family transposase
MKLSLDRLLGAAVRSELVAGYSSAAVSIRLQRKVCTETIYKAVYEARSVGSPLDSAFTLDDCGVNAVFNQTFCSIVR